MTLQGRWQRRQSPTKDRGSRDSAVRNNTGDSIARLDARGGAVRHDGSAGKRETSESKM